MSAIIAVANQKGGVGKTTTVVSLGHYFARAGRRVLIVDFDVQGHAATCLGKAKGRGLFDLLVNEDPLGSVAKPARQGLDLVASDKSTERIKLFLNDVIHREVYVAEHLEAARAAYDLVLLDLAPGSDILHVGALAACDWFLVPARMGLLEHDGVNEVLNTVRALARIPGMQLPGLVGVLPTMFERVTRETEEARRRLAEQIGATAILPPVPSDTHMREAIARGMTIWEYAPESAAAIGYAAHGAAAVNGRGRVGGYLHLGELIDALVGG